MVLIKVPVAGRGSKGMFGQLLDYAPDQAKNIRPRLGCKGALKLLAYQL